ncbi:DEAD/DEAH box helicase [Streptomyces sp. NPDC006785]|uniref:DEAD/DEAH box helicase n=1 Tax=Streptomyces sp. NPDC006785 TaxID=3155461 RepID=UPI0033CC5166
MRDYGGVVASSGRDALTSGEAAPRLRAQLRAHVLGEQISSEGTAAFTYDLAGLRRGLTLARLGQLARSPRERRADPEPLTAIAEAYADLAGRYPEAEPARIELLAIAATMWSLAGYQANATTLANSFQREADAYFANGDVPMPASRAPYEIAQLTGAMLRRDIDRTALLGARAQREVSDLGRRLLTDIRGGVADQADLAVLAAYGLVGRAARSLASLWRFGDRAAGTAALADLRKAATVLLDASVVDTWTLVDCLAYAVEDIVATSPWLLLRRSATWGHTWERYLRALLVCHRPMTQVWPSQRRALDAGLVDAPARSLAVTMPTSAGKTHIAEWAILHALTPQDDNWWRSLLPDLAVYVVPTRALAAQVERHLAESLELVGLRVSSLFGGAEHVRYETELLNFTDVLVVTSEKLDLLLRNMPELTSRLRLVLVDEGHSLDKSERGLRLEMLLSRIRRSTPTARVVLLSAVLPNGEDIARWLDPSANGTNQANIDWSPSRLRTGVFSWRGREEDGQRGAIDYGSTGTDEFFLPRILTRKKKRTKLFPSDPKDVAAALALHFDRLGPVLIAAPTKPTARAAARSLQRALSGPDVPELGSTSEAQSLAMETIRQQREALQREISDHVGADHELASMVLQGFAYHHADVPQAVRHALERAYREGTLRVLCATSTLSQGMNLPTKTVIVSGTSRGPAGDLTVRDFWNTAGRAGRAFQEIEGHVILLARTASEAAGLRRRYLDKSNIEGVQSTLLALYRGLVAARWGARLPADGQDLSDLVLLAPETGDLAVWADGMDIQLLAQLSEEVVDTPDEHILEDAARDLLAHTLGSQQIGAHGWSLQPLTRFAARRVAGIARRIPDREARAAIVRTGLSVQGGIDVLAMADAIAEALQENPFLFSENAADLLDFILNTSTTVHEVRQGAARKKVPLEAIAPAATAWIAGSTVPDLHTAHHQALGTKEITDTTTVIDKVISHDLAWAVSALLQALELRHGAPAVGWLAALPAMLKYGVSTPAACYASSLGIHSRAAAMNLASHCPDPQPTFGFFLDWLSNLTAGELTSITTPEVAALLIRSTERLSPRAAQRTILSGQGTFVTPLRGVRHAGSAVVLSSVLRGTELRLIRDPGNPVDPNAIRIEFDGVFLGWVARETARPLALILDDDPAPTVRATLVTDTRSLVQEQGIDQLAAKDQVLIAVTLE